MNEPTKNKLREKYKEIVLKPYMSEIKGDVLKEFLLAIHLLNARGEGEILEENGTIQKLKFPMDNEKLKNILLGINSQDIYLFIWQPGGPMEKSMHKLTKGPHVSNKNKHIPMAVNSHSVNGEKDELLSGIQKLLENHVKEFGLWGVILTDAAGEPLAWAISEETIREYTECWNANFRENLVMKLIKLFIQSESECIDKLISGLADYDFSLPRENLNLCITLIHKKHIVKARFVTGSHVLVIIAPNEQLGVSTIAENKLLRELREILSNTERPKIRKKQSL